MIESGFLIVYSSTGFGLIIDFGSQALEDIFIISNEEEALARLRIRSIPLQGEDCSLIEEGERVLATHKSQFKTLSFDAMVAKVLSLSLNIKLEGILIGLRNLIYCHKMILLMCGAAKRWILVVLDF